MRKYSLLALLLIAWAGKSWGQSGYISQPIQPPNGWYPIVETTQILPKNSALVYQNGDDNFAQISQVTLICDICGINEGEITQIGDENIAKLFQNGADNSAEMRQIGNNNKMELRQLGDGNFAQLSQFGNNLILPTIIQEGGAVIVVEQRE